MALTEKSLSTEVFVKAFFIILECQMCREGPVEVSRSRKLLEENH